MSNLNTRWYEHAQDLELIAAIDTKGHEEYWMPEDFKKRLKQKSVTCRIAEIDGVAVGFIVYELFLHRFAILRIGVLPQFRRQKIGTALLKELNEKLTEKRILISAEVRESNLPVHLFLKSQMYRAVEVIRNYYSDTQEDAYLFHYLGDKEVAST